MTSDNAARSINRTLKEFFDVFGGNSAEYRYLYNIVRKSMEGSVFRPEGIIKGDNAISPLQLSRSKATLKEYDALHLEKLNKKIKSHGSAKQVISDRIIEQRKRGDKDYSFTNARADSYYIWLFDNNREDIYESMYKSNDAEGLDFFSNINNLPLDVQANEIKKILDKYHNLKDKQQQDNDDILDNTSETIIGGNLSDYGI